MSDVLLLMQVVGERAWEARSAAYDLLIDVLMCAVLVALFVAIILEYGAW